MLATNEANDLLEPVLSRPKRLMAFARSRSRHLASVASEKDTYVLLVDSNEETMTSQQLAERGVDTFIPILKRWRLVPKNRRNSRSGRREKEQQEYIAAPGYMLLMVDRGDPIPWAALSTCHAVRGLLGNGGVPKKVPTIQGSKFIGKFSEGLKDPNESAIDPSIDFNVGDRILITDGVAEGRTVEIIDLKSGQAEFVTKMFGADVRSKIDLDKVEKV